MQNRKFERAAKNRRVFAIFLAMVLHFAILGAILYGSGEQESSIAEKVKSWVGLEQQADTEEVVP